MLLRNAAQSLSRETKRHLLDIAKEFVTAGLRPVKCPYPDFLERRVPSLRRSPEAPPFNSFRPVRHSSGEFATASAPPRPALRREWRINPEQPACRLRRFAIQGE